MFCHPETVLKVQFPVHFPVRIPVLQHLSHGQNAKKNSMIFGECFALSRLRKHKKIREIHSKFTLIRLGFLRRTRPNVARQW